MTVNINKNLNLNITDFLLLQEISEMKLNRILGNDPLTNNPIKFYDSYKSYSTTNTINDIKEQFYVAVGAQNNLDNNNSIEYIGGAGAYTKISQTQADYFLDNYEIVDYYGNDNTGFSATTFRKKGTDEITISFRSTEFKEDYYKDAYGADTEINNNGTAIAQNISLVNYLQKLKDTGIIKPKNSDPKANATEVYLTGYSLGGHLASSAYQYLTYDNYDIKKLYVFNGPGVGNVLDPLNSGTPDYSVTTSNFGLLKNDLMNYSKLLELFNDFYNHNITTKQDALFFINANSKYSIFYDFISNINNSSLNSTLSNSNSLKNSTLSIYNSQLYSYSEHENEISRNSNIQNNDNTDYLETTIYESSIYKEFKSFIINKYGMTKASTGGNTITNTATETQSFIVASQSEKTGVYSPDLFGLNTLWINGQSSINNFDYLSNDFNFVAGSNRYGEDVSLVIEDRPETEDELARVPIAESFTKTLNGDFGNTHSITLLNKTLNLMATLAKLEGKSSINTAKYSALISSSSKERASHFYSKSDGSVGTGDYNAIANIVNTLSNLLLTSQGKPQVMFDNTLGGWANIDKLNQLDEIESKLIQTKISNLNFISLYNIKSSDLSRAEFNTTQYDYISKTELISKAKSNIAYRYALDYLNTFVVEGLDYSNYSNSIDTSHSEQWYSSRADILLKIIDSNVGNLNNYTSSGYNDENITGNSNIYVNDKKQDLVFHSNNINYNLQNNVYNINSYYTQSQSFNTVSSLDSSILRTINQVIANKVGTPEATALGFLGPVAAAGLVIYFPVVGLGLGVAALGLLAGGGVATVIHNSINFNNVYLPSNSGSYSIAGATYFNKNIRGSDLQKYIDNLNYRNSLSIDKNIYFLDNYMSNYQTNNSKNKNENVFINVDKNLLFSFIQNPANNSIFNNTTYTYKEGLSSAQTIDDIDIRHNVRLGDGSDYLEITDDGISNVFSTSGKKNYYLKGTKTYITDPEKSGTITLDGILLDGGIIIMENGFVDVNKRVQTFQSATELDDLGNPKEYKITYRFNTDGNNKNYIITNEQTGHQVIITGLSNFGNGSAFGFKELVSHDFNEQNNVSIENFSNDNVYTSGIGYISKDVTGYYDSTVDTEALVNISINISNENIVATRDPNNLTDLVVYDKTNPKNIHTIANFFDALGALKEHVYYVFDGDNYNAQYLHYKINNTELSTILQYNPTMSSPGLTEMSPTLQNQGYTSYELNTSLNIVLNYTPYAKYFLDNSLIASTGFKREGNDLILYSLDYNVPQGLINGVLPTGTNIIKNYFAFDHSNTTNFYMHRYGQNISLSVSDLIQRTAVRLAENSSNYVMDENSYKTVVSGVGDDIVIGTEANETFISRTVIDYNGLVGQSFSDGNDTFTGGGGADIYSFSGNFGYDTITDFNNESIIYIDNSYNDTDYQFLKQGNDLIIYKELDDTTEEYSQVTVKNYFTNIDYQNSSRIIFTRVQEHYTELYSDPNYVPETYYNFNSSDIELFNTTDMSKTSDEVIEQTAKDNSNNSVDTSKLSSSHIKGNDLDNTIIIRNNDTVIHSNQTAELTDGDDTYIIDIAENEAVPQNHNVYRTTIEFGFNSGHDLLLNAKFKQMAQYGDIVDLKNIDSSSLTVNALKDENNITVGFNLILQDGSSLLISVNDLSDTNVAMVKTNTGTLTLNNLISMSSPSVITGDSMNNSFDLSNSIKSVSINSLDGNDVIVGGQADDSIEGGRGFDKFLFSKGYDTYKFNANSDIDTFDMEEMTSNDILALSARFLVDTSYKTNGVSHTMLKKTKDTLN